MAETLLFNVPPRNLSAHVYSCASVQSYHITNSEAKILHDISVHNVDYLNMEKRFVAGRDCIVRLEDVEEFNLFIEICYDALRNVFNPNRLNKCGYISINSKSVVPYSIKEGKKYIPIFFLGRAFSEEMPEVIKLENWNLAYIKFCCKIELIYDHLFDGDSCLAVSFDTVMERLDESTVFLDVWPTKVDKRELVLNHKNSRVSPLSAWIKTPSTQ